MEEFLSRLEETLNGVEGIDLTAIKEEANKINREFNDEKTRLVNKNQELLSDLKKAKKAKDEAKNKLEEIDIDEYNRLKEEEENRILNGDKGSANVNIDDIKDKLERKYKAIIDKKDGEIKTLSESVKQKDNVINSTLIENEISKQLASGLKIRDEFKPMLTDYFKSKSFVEDDGEDKTIFIKDKTGDTPISTFFEYWGNSEEAKSYLKAEETSGAGTSGSKKFTKTKSFSEMTPAEKVALFKNNPTEYARLKNN